ncbi:MAG TPA: acyl carrier protein [Gammaproteobacteria bacterium]|nr:acyl carrier protein [Gammaproteobacteria bacterium]
MSTTDIAARVETVFGRVFGKRMPFAPQLSRLDEPRWNSMKHMEFLLGLEQEFGIRFDGADATDMVSMPDVVARVGSKLQ